MRPSALTALAAVLIAGTATAEEVNVYSYRQPELIEPIFDVFTKETGIKVNVAFLNNGMVERLVAEGDRSPADLVFTVDVARLAEIVEAGVIQPVESEALTAHIPADFRDADNRWFAVTSRARVVYASRERVADGDITTYEDLADPKWAGRICTRSGTHEYNVALAGAYLLHHGPEETRTWLEGLKANLARKPQGNDRAQVKAIWSGECDISLGNTYYMGQMLDDPEQVPWAESVRLLFPVFETGGTHVNISGIAMTKSAPNRDNALKLMEFLASPEGQQLYAEKNDEYPVTPGTPPSDRVAAWGSFTPDTLDLIELAKSRPEALRLIESVDFDG